MATTLSWVLAPSTISMNGTYGRYTKDTMDNNGIPHLFVPTCRSLSVHVLPLMCRKCPMVIWIVTLLFRFLCNDSQHHVFSLDAPLTSLHVAILFGNSNRPTLFICYPGSIEKLTLLGAIYYY